MENFNGIAAMDQSIRLLPNPTPPTPAPTPPVAAPIPPPAALFPAATTDDLEHVRPNELLLDILSTRRAHGSLGDTNFRLWLHAKLRNLGFTPQIARGGSVIVEVKKSTTLFSCHIDTCHGQTESDGSRQKLAYDPIFGHIFLADKASSGCLGGDDGVGVYIMLRMLAKKVPGTYVFHTGEEQGGLGSKELLATKADWLQNFDRCIAFDRAVQHQESPEVICTQGGMSCASLEFGAQLVLALNAHPFDEPWVISHKGTFTDSKVYAGIIPECVNLGCFYVNQHSPNETVEAWGVEKLVDAALKIKWEKLTPSRKPVKPSVFSQQNRFPKATKGGPEADDGYGYGYGGFDDAGLGYGRNSYRPPSAPLRPPSAPLPPPPATKRPAPIPTKGHGSLLTEALEYSADDIVDLVDNDPQIAADLICVLLAKYKGLVVENEMLNGFFGA